MYHSLCNVFKNTNAKGRLGKRKYEVCHVLFPVGRSSDRSLCLPVVQICRKHSGGKYTVCSDIDAYSHFYYRRNPSGWIVRYGRCIKFLADQGTQTGNFKRLSYRSICNYHLLYVFYSVFRLFF